MKKSTQVLGTDSSPGVKNSDIEQGLIGRQIEPHFMWNADNAESTATILVDGWQTGSGNDMIRVPFHLVNSSLESNSWQTLDIEGPWTMNVSLSTTTVATKLGGIIDGLGNLAYDDLLLWAFMDENAFPKFKGLGFTIKPILAYTAMSDGSFGSSTTFTLAGAGPNIGFRIPVTARVLCRETTALGGRWNHGTVTSRTASTIRVTLDNGALYGVALAGATGEIIQLDQFEPRMASAGEDSLYPGSGSEYTFAYMGSLSIGQSKNQIGQVRKRGDYYYLHQETLVHNISAGIGSTNTDTIRLGQWMPHHAREVELELAGRNMTSGASNNTYALLYPSNHVGNNYPRLKLSSIMPDWLSGEEDITIWTTTGRLPPRRQNGGLTSNITSSLDTVQIWAYLIGWREDRF